MTASDFAPMLQDMRRFKQKVDRLILDELLPPSHAVPEIDLLYKMMRDYPERPAKGMRPYLCVTSCLAFGGTEDQALLTAATLELFQNWILIHDDIEDGSEMRRGSPALHKKYHWALALNAGDALHAKMWNSLLWNRSRLGDARTLDIMREFAFMINETTEGQQMELGWVVGNKWEISEEDYCQMCTKKTSWYTTISPLRLGGLAAGAPEDKIDPLIEAGKKLGVGFQIHDDVLNLSAGAKYGKETADDLLEGKRTLILIKMLSSATPEDRELAVKIFSMSREERKDHTGDLIKMIHKYGALDYARMRSMQLVNEAVSMLKRIRWDGDRAAVQRIEEIAKFAVERDW